MHRHRNTFVFSDLHTCTCVQYLSSTLCVFLACVSCSTVRSQIMFHSDGKGGTYTDIIILFHYCFFLLYKESTPWKTLENKKHTWNILLLRLTMLVTILRSAQLVRVQSLSVLPNLGSKAITNHGKTDRRRLLHSAARCLAVSVVCAL